MNGRTIVLVGNPNSGKTTLFNKLTGSSQRVGNWPGVTIEKKAGTIRNSDNVELIDTPGIYSLSPYSLEEKVTRSCLLEDDPDVIINILDASNIERNLYLTLQVLETGIPTVVALNMTDVLEKKGIHIDAGALSQKLGCPVVSISAIRSKGLQELVDMALSVPEGGSSKGLPFGRDLETLVCMAYSELEGTVPDLKRRWYSVKLVERDPMVSESCSKSFSRLSPVINEFEERHGDTMDSLVVGARYDQISDILSDVMEKPDAGSSEVSLSDRIDRIVTHRVVGIPIFIGILGAVFLGIIGFGDYPGIGTYLTDLLNGYIEELGVIIEEWCIENNVSEMLTGFILSVFIGGVGAVIGFLPQMLVLFLALYLLEDIGYMARAAFLMDRVFRFFGLSGKSFIPLLVGTGCGVPGIMATRAIECEADRKITAMTVTFMPCGAKLPIIALIAGALFGGNGFVALFAYLFGIFAVLLSGILLKKMKGLSGDSAPFIMELPPYHLPTAYNVIRETLRRGWAFVRKAGTIILLASLVIWFLGSFSTSMTYVGTDAAAGSILQVIGESICIIFQPLGWGDHWELSVGTITGLIAKENLVGTLGTLFAMEDVGEYGEEYWAILATHLTPAAGLSFLVFNLLCAPCFAAIGAMRSELGSWKTTGAAVLYQCSLAYALASVVYVVGSFMWGYVPDVLGVVISTVSVAVIAYLLIFRSPLEKYGRFNCVGEIYE